MRRMLPAAVLAACVAAALAGCGSSGKPAASSPLTDALSYFPTSTPLVAMIQTASNSQAIEQARTLEQRVPDAAFAETGLFAELAKIGINYNTDVRPLLGNPVAFGAVGSNLSGTNTPFLLAWRTRSAKTLLTLVAKIPSLQRAGTHDGAKLFIGSRFAVGVAGSTIIASQSTSQVEAALARHSHHQGFTAAEYASDTRGIAQSGLVEIVGNLSGTLATPQAAQARQIPWIAAIKGYGAAITASANAIQFQFHADTSGRTLTSTDLPVAAGSRGAGLDGILPILVGIRDPAQIWSFGTAVARATSPKGYAKLQRDEATLQRKTGFDGDAFLGLLTGNAYLQSDTHTTVARLQVSNASKASAMLAQLMKAPTTAGVFDKGSTVRRLRGGLYAVHEPKQTLVLGVIGNQLAIGHGSPAQIRAYATSSHTVAAGSGAVTFKIALADLLHITLKHPPSAIGQQFLNLLGNITGSATASPSGVTGSAALGVK